jgi:hypothetical protein
VKGIASRKTEQLSAIWTSIERGSDAWGSAFAEVIADDKSMFRCDVDGITKAPDE